MNQDQSINSELRAPFPWFGGKRRVADLVWDRFGNVDTYNEPFAGSLAVLLGRPSEPKVETVNDLNAFLANFWRALQHDPDGVAFHADWPVNEADLHARHRWLVEQGKAIAEQVMTDPDFYDAKIAGWWVWGQCLWIGSGWCSESDKRNQVPWKQRKKQRGGDVGVHSLQKHGSVRMEGQIQRQARKRPHLATGNGDGTGVHRGGLSERRWQGGGQGGGSGVHSPTLTRKMPSIGVPDGRQCGGGRGIFTEELRSVGLYDYMRQLYARLRRVRVCCGDWKRVLTPSVTTYIGITGVFLDPPYSHELRERCYSEDHDISVDVRQWAIEHGNDPKMRIALCGYQDEHGAHMPSTWECVPWKAHGGYSRSERAVENREQERIWFSPHCMQPGLFAQFGEHTA